MHNVPVLPYIHIQIVFYIYFVHVYFNLVSINLLIALKTHFRKSNY